jgi:Beta/Gamma crystallin
MSISPIAKIYQNSDFTGQTYWTSLSELANPDLSKISRGNMASSLQLFDSNYTVTLYDGANYTGQSITFRYPQQISNLQDYGFNDKTSSIKCELASPYFVILYKDANGQGKSSYLTIGSYSSLSNSIGNDIVSSVLLTPGMRVALYKDANFGGTYETHQNNTAAPVIINLTYNDSASSALVYRAY